MGKKILIADDEERVRKLVRTILELAKSGFEIYEAVDGDEAYKMAKKIKPDLMVLDIMMPGMNGYDVCKKLKSSDATRKIYVLILTARGSSLSERTMELVGADAFLAKPFTPLELELTVKNAFGM